MTRLKPIAVATLAVLALLAGAAAPAAANHDSTDEDAGIADSLFGTSDSNDTGVLDTVSAALGVASGTLDRAYYESPFGPEPDAAEKNAEELMTAFNDRNASLVSEANTENVSGGEVAKITFDQTDSEAVIYIVSTYNETSGAYESARVVTDTDRHVDETVTLSGMAADNAAAVLEEFHAKFVESDEDVSKAWLAKQWATYNEDLESSLIEGGEVA
jgi:hypothetical protein